MADRPKKQAFSAFPDLRGAIESQITKRILRYHFPPDFFDSHPIKLSKIADSA